MFTEFHNVGARFVRGTKASKWQLLWGKTCCVTFCPSYSFKAPTTNCLYFCGIWYPKQSAHSIMGFRENSEYLYRISAGKHLLSPWVSYLAMISCNISAFTP